MGKCTCSGMFDWCGVFGGVWDGGCGVSWHRGSYREGFVDGVFFLFFVTRLSWNNTVETDRQTDGSGHGLFDVYRAPYCTV